MKIFAVFLLTVVFSSSHATVSTFGTKAPPLFELCFESQHGRCFRTAQAGMFRQYGGLSDSEAFLPETEQKRLHKEITQFFSNVKYAKAKKTKTCAKPFVFRQLSKTPATEDIRCLERLKKKDSEKLLSLITQVSLATKPL